MSRVEQIENELTKLSAEELRQVRDRLEDMPELKFTDEFEAAIQRSEREMSEGLLDEQFR